MQRIDLKDVLSRAVSGPYGDLVTRRTGQAVRSEIEEMLDALPDTFTDDQYEQKCQVIYQHVFESYSGPNQSVYVVA